MADLMGELWSGSATPAFEDKKVALVSERELSDGSSDEGGLESGPPSQDDRPLPLIQAVVIMFSLLLQVLCIGLGFKELAMGIVITKDYSHAALLVTVPFTMFLSLVSSKSLSRKHVN